MSGRCGLVGGALGHSWSPEIHAQLGGGYSYELLPLTPAGLDELLRGGDFLGLNVTIPYKKTVVPYCAELTPAARAIGSVNTLVRRADGTLLGDNTDADGFRFLARRAGVDFARKKVLILGTGGTSLTAQYVVRGAGGTPVVVSRTGENNYGNLEQHADAAVLVNTTPVGMFPHAAQTPVDLARLPALEAVLDVVYNPLHTELCLEAAARGLRCGGGLPMLVAQAARASERFTGRAVPAQRVEEILRGLEERERNIVLIGMPGSGKSTVGALLAARLGRPLLDTDAEVARLSGKSPAALIEQEGEDAFRACEAEAAAALGQRTGCVIATGGGVVKTPANYRSLRRNGVIVRLLRDADKLEAAGRPLSQGGLAHLRRLEQEREPLYAAFADLAADNNGPPEQTAASILEEIAKL